MIVVTAFAMMFVPAADVHMQALAAMTMTVPVTLMANKLDIGFRRNLRALKGWSGGSVRCGERHNSKNSQRARG